MLPHFSPKHTRQSRQSQDCYIFLANFSLTGHPGTPSGTGALSLSRSDHKLVEDADELLGLAGRKYTRPVRRCIASARKSVVGHVNKCNAIRQLVRTLLRKITIAAATNGLRSRPSQRNLDSQA